MSATGDTSARSGSTAAANARSSAAGTDARGPADGRITTAGHGGGAPPDLALLRLVAQRVAGPRPATAADAVRWLTAVQAQDLRAALAAVALRTTTGTREAAGAALATGEVVRSWPMRGTLHLVPAEDLPWLLELTAARAVARAARRRAQLGLDDATIERAREVAVAALAGGNRLRRAELLAAWQEAGVATAGQRGYHLLAHLSQTGTLCLGPVRDGEQLFVLIDEWIKEPRRLAREEALGELALRYFRGHGPATRADFVRWTGLTVADARTGLELARPALARLELDGVEYLLDPATPRALDACRDEAAGLFLLPSFDELLLGYADRTATLPARYADRVVPGGNGVFQPTIVYGGRVVGTWRRTGRRVTSAPFESLPDEVARRVTELAAAALW